MTQQLLCIGIMHGFTAAKANKRRRFWLLRLEWPCLFGSVSRVGFCSEVTVIRVLLLIYLSKCELITYAQTQIRIAQPTRSKFCVNMSSKERLKNVSVGKQLHCGSLM